MKSTKKALAEAIIIVLLAFTAMPAKAQDTQPPGETVTVQQAATVAACTAKEGPAPLCAAALLDKYWLCYVNGKERYQNTPCHAQKDGGDK